MRVAHLFRGFHDYMAGLLNAQAEIADVHVLLGQRDEIFIPALHPRITVHRTGMPTTRSLKNATRLPRLRSLIRKLEPDILHLQAGLIWEWGATFGPRRFPVIATVHDIVNHPATGWLPRPPASLTALAAKSADAIIVHGESLKEQARDHFGGSSTQIFTVDHPVITRYGTGAARTVVPPGQGNVLFFGYLQKNKGLEYLVAAQQLLRQQMPDLSFTVAGSTSDPTHFEDLLGRRSGLNLDMGFQDASAVERLFRWADVIVLPYIEASQSGVLQLAAAFAVPPVATTVGGLKDVVVDQANGLLIPPRSPQALAAAIQRLLVDANLRTRVVKQLVHDRENRFSGRNIAFQTQEVYQSALNSFTARHPDANSVSAERRSATGERFLG